MSDLDATLDELFDSTTSWPAARADTADEKGRQVRCHVTLAPPVNKPRPHKRNHYVYRLEFPIGPAQPTVVGHEYTGGEQKKEEKKTCVPLSRANGNPIYVYMCVCSIYIYMCVCVCVHVLYSEGF